ncbi:MAG: pyrroline-5-carboxylate reductase [Phycisphaerales bacterium]|jgi:pyrroline-5-carboxylate reductase|nr:pyrroline-5-carboxylate reductase [Phycisphaerales bacterium]
MDVPLACIGGGNMARALLAGYAGKFVVAEPDPARRGAFPNAVASAGEAMDWLERVEAEAGAGQVMLAIKPQMLGDVARELGERVSGGTGRVVITMLAGTPSERVARALGGEGAERVRVVRIMPNTPAQIGKGITAIAVGAHAKGGDDALARTILARAGQVIDVDESMMDAFTALAGSGPAYVFALCEAMQRAGESLGFSPDDAARIARATLVGAAALLERSEDSASVLRERVTSKGGTTEAALRVLRERGLDELMRAAITVARDRGAELARETH